MSNVRFVGLDVHAETIAIAVADRDGETRSVGVIPNRPDHLRQAMAKLGPPEDLQVCYEAGPTGYVVYWQLMQLGIACVVVAPTLVPMRAGDRVKTDRRDAIKLARSYRAGELTPVWVPDAAHEALRDLVRAREVAKRDLARARHRFVKYLLRHGRRPAAAMRAWTDRYVRWAETVRFPFPAQEATRLDYWHEVGHGEARLARLDQAIAEIVQVAPVATRVVIEALQALRGIAQVSAVTIVAELGRLSRFAHPRQLMGYCGIVASEHSSGPRIRRGGITRAGNAHLRRVVVEAAWAYRHPPAVGPTLRRRQQGLDPEICEMAWHAQHRLCKRYRRLVGKGKAQQHVVTAVGRELLGFIWAIAIHVEATSPPASAAA